MSSPQRPLSKRSHLSLNAASGRDVILFQKIRQSTIIVIPVSRKHWT